MAADHRLYSLYRTNFYLESEALADLLMAHGVPATSRWSGMAPEAQRCPAEDLTLAEVVVYRSDLERALGIMHDYAVNLPATLVQSEDLVVRNGWRGFLQSVGIMFLAGLVAFASPFVFLWFIARWFIRQRWNALFDLLFAAGLFVLSPLFILAALVYATYKVLDAIYLFFAKTRFRLR